MKTIWMMSLLLSGIVAGTQLQAHASDNCDSTESCAAPQPMTLSEDVTPELTDFARNGDGSIRKLNQGDADSYCRSQGQQLPTARELALYAHSLGAQGIVSTENEGYRVRGAGKLGNPDVFYYSNYQMPAGDIFDLWSSSAQLIVSGHSYFLDVFHGQLWFVGNYNHFAVRCIWSR